MYSRRTGKLISKEYTKSVPEQIPNPNFDKHDIPILEKIIEELSEIEKFIRDNIHPYLQQLLESKRGNKSDAAEWQDIFNEQWKDAVANFGQLPKAFLEKLRALKLDNYVATPDVSELIKNLSLPPHIARVYGAETGKMLVDVNQAKMALKKYLEILKQSS